MVYDPAFKAFADAPFDDIEAGKRQDLKERNISFIVAICLFVPTFFVALSVALGFFGVSEDIRVVGGGVFGSLLNIVIGQINKPR